jgi:hypothetical protein
VQLAGDLAGTATAPTVPGLADKEPAITAGTTGQYYRGDKSFQTLDKTAVGLANVDNTSDSNKPVSTATTTALNLKVDKSTATTKGDILAATAASTITRVGVGTDGQILTADATSAPGLKWATPASALVTSVVGQTGEVTGSQIAGDSALLGAFVKKYTQRVNVRDEGAVGDGSTDDSAAFAAAALKAKNAAVALVATGTDPTGKIVIEVPPGNYRVTQHGAILGSEGMTTKAHGIAWEGSGQRISNIIWDPAVAGTSPMVTRRWMGIQVSNMGFYTTASDAHLITSIVAETANMNPQRVRWQNCYFSGWRYLAKLGGTNNNSEWTFDDCGTSSFKTNGAIIYSPLPRTVTDASITNGSAVVQSSTGAFTHKDYGVNIIGAGIPLGAYVMSVDSQTQITLSDACTATTSGVSAIIGQSTDQFLNYWFNDLKHWSTSAPIVDLAKGGHVHVKNADISDWGTDLNTITAVSNKSATTTTATLSVASHTFIVGDRIVVLISDANFDGEWIVSSCTSTSITYNRIGSSVSSTAASGSITLKTSIFTLRGTNHALGVCSALLDGVRVEGKTVNTSVLYSEWPYGLVDIRGLDISSQSGTYTYGEVVTLVYVNTNGASYSISNSSMAGLIGVYYSTSESGTMKSIQVHNCEWRQKVSPTDAIRYVSTTGVNIGCTPSTTFTSCRGVGTGALVGARNAPVAGTASGAAVWDATVGLRGQPLQVLPKRWLSVRNSDGAIPATATNTYLLPVGAIITDFRIDLPVGATGSAGNATWTLTTNEVSPVTVATLTVTNLSLGASTNALTLPFLCSTTLKANLVVTPTSVAVAVAPAVLSIGGYW